MTYTQRSAAGQGWEDAKAGKQNNNPYLHSDFRWALYEKGFNDFEVSRTRAKNKQEKKSHA